MSASVPPSKSVPSRIQVYRAGGYAAAFVITAAAYWFAPRYPWLVPPANALVLYIGTRLGIPTDWIVQLALAMIASARPERAMQITSSALKSLPPGAHADATRSLLQSLPPGAMAAAGVVLVPDPDNPLTAPPPPPPLGR
jgi:hypothetical protein